MRRLLRELGRERKTSADLDQVGGRGSGQPDVEMLQSEVAAVKLAEFDMGVDPPMSPAISESFGKFPLSSVQIIIIQKNQFLNL